VTITTTPSTTSMAATTTTGNTEMVAANTTAAAAGTERTTTTKQDKPRPSSSLSGNSNHSPPEKEQIEGQGQEKTRQQKPKQQKTRHKVPMLSWFASLIAVFTLCITGSNGATVAGFTNSFQGIKAGSAVTLTWDTVGKEYLPLCITAQLVDGKGNRDGGGDGRVNVFKANITSEFWSFLFLLPPRWFLGFGQEDHGRGWFNEQWSVRHECLVSPWKSSLRWTRSRWRWAWRS